MPGILVVVESPAKIAKIKSFLDKSHKVEASMGIFRDLDPKKMSIDFDNQFEPIYIVTKPDVVSNLKKAFKGADMLYIASDLDYEGDGIAQSIYDVLKPKSYKRLVFNSITKEAILKAIESGGEINKNRVDAQKTRRVIDRLFGYMISPVLQKKLKGNLSAGRVQSVATRIIIEKENEINKFIGDDKESYFKVSGVFVSGKSSDMKSTLHLSEKTVFKGSTAMIPVSENNAQVIDFLKTCLKSTFFIHSVENRISVRNPSPPFTTSTLQQEANRKLGMTIDNTMKVAQKLYESGHITYMRTDSVNISPDGHAILKKAVIDKYGNEYYKKNDYQTKNASSQEAHEAIRPVHPETDISGDIKDEYQLKLYNLIWKRAVASQMKPAEIDVMTIKIGISEYIETKKPHYYFQTEYESVVFPGFMKAYVESKDDEEDETKQANVPKISPKKGDKLSMKEINAVQEYPRPPPRYTQASLVKKLEELGIGRPSTYVNTINTIIEREYVRIGDILGVEKDATSYQIKSDNGKHVMKIFEEENKIHLGQEKGKLIPTELGKKVHSFLIEFFTEMLDYDFTAKMEKDMDDIAEGTKKWKTVVKKFYDKLNPIVEKVNAMKIEKINVSLGKDREGNELTVSETKFGPVVVKTVGDTKLYAKIKPPLTVENIKLKDAIELFEYPKLLGKYEGKDVLLYKGAFGLFLSYNKQKYAVPDKNDININRAIEVIKEKESNVLKEYTIEDKGKKIKVIVLKGPYGNYIQVMRGTKKQNYSIPQSYDYANLSEEDIKTIIYSKKPRMKKDVAAKGGNYRKKSTGSGSKKVSKKKRVG